MVVRRHVGRGMEPTPLRARRLRRIDRRPAPVCCGIVCDGRRRSGPVGPRRCQAPPALHGILTRKFFSGSELDSGPMREIDRLLEVVRGRGAKTIGLQFPVGLRTKAVELARELEANAGVTVLVSADPSFGACDVADMPVDLIVHLGHAPMPHLRYNRVFFYDLPGPPLGSMTFIDAAEPMLPKRVGLLTTTQFRHWLPAIQAHLEKKGHVVRIGEPDRRVAYAGQLLGCDYHTATVVEGDVDGYLYIGTGDFHPLGVAILVDKPVIIADPERGT